MAQLTLFESTDRVIVDDERGRITYTPGFVDSATADGWFAELRQAVDWHGGRRMMYDREVDVPRLMAHYRLDPPPDGTPEPLVVAGRRVADALGVPFNSVGLNLYRDGRDSVAPHNDHLHEIRKGFPIALLSLGATRRMTIRVKPNARLKPDATVTQDATEKQTIHVDLEPGSLFVMDYATQLHYTHAVPKTTEPVGERISLAFRVKRARPPRADGTDTGFYR